VIDFYKQIESASANMGFTLVRTIEPIFMAPQDIVKRLNVKDVIAPWLSYQLALFILF